MDLSQKCGYPILKIKCWWKLVIYNGVSVHFKKCYPILIMVIYPLFVDTPSLNFGLVQFQTNPNQRKTHFFSSSTLLLKHGSKEIRSLKNEHVWTSFQLSKKNSCTSLSVLSSFQGQPLVVNIFLFAAWLVNFHSEQETQGISTTHRGGWVSSATTNHSRF